MHGTGATRNIEWETQSDGQKQLDRNSDTETETER